MTTSGGHQMKTVTNDTVPWRLRDGNALPNGALTHWQMQALGSTYGFSASQMVDLSKRVDIGLSRELHMTFPELVDDRARRGRSELESAVKHLAAVKKNLAKAMATIERVRVRSPFRHPDIEHRETLEQAREAIDEAVWFYAIAVRENLAIYTAHPDKRRTYDIRREIVCTGIFNVWTEAGRPLSFTTDPITSRRGGPLLEFVNAVVEYITEPPSTLSGEAIRTEIDRYYAPGPRD